MLQGKTNYSFWIHYLLEDFPSRHLGTTTWWKNYENRAKFFITCKNHLDYFSIPAVDCYRLFDLICSNLRDSFLYQTQQPYIMKLLLDWSLLFGQFCEQSCQYEKLEQLLNQCIELLVKFEAMTNCLDSYLHSSHLLPILYQMKSQCYEKWLPNQMKYKAANQILLLQKQEEEKVILPRNIAMAYAQLQSKRN